MLSQPKKWQIAQSIEIKWWQNYLKNKEVAPYLAWKKQYWQGLLDKIKEYYIIQPNSTILDMGCGPSGIYMALQEHRVDAIDPLLDAYSANIKHFNKLDYAHVNFTSKAFEDFEITKKYDVIFCMNAINHVKNLEDCYLKMSQALAPNGLLVVTIDAHNYNFFKYLFRAIPGDMLHPYQFDLKEYDSFLEKNNIKVEQNICLKKEFFFDHYMQIAIKK